MSRRKVYDVWNKLRIKADKTENEEDRDELDGFVSELGEGIYGWEQDIKRSAAIFGIRNSAYPGDMLGWSDDELDLPEDNDDKGEDDDQNKKKPKS